jgi:hypothetical protein
VVAITVGVAFLDEPVRLRLLAGAALVVVGIALLQERLQRFRRLPVATATVAVLLLVLLARCGGGAGTNGDDGATDTTARTAPGAARGAAGCAAPVEEPLDPGSARHLLPGAPEPTYLTDPPPTRPDAGSRRARSTSRSPARIRSPCSKRAGWSCSTETQPTPTSSPPSPPPTWSSPPTPTCPRPSS